MADKSNIHYCRQEGSQSTVDLISSWNVGNPHFIGLGVQSPVFSLQSLLTKVLLKILTALNSWLMDHLRNWVTAGFLLPFWHSFNRYWWSSSCMKGPWNTEVGQCQGPPFHSSQGLCPQPFAVGLLDFVNHMKLLHLMLDFPITPRIEFQVVAGNQYMFADWLYDREDPSFCIYYFFSIVCLLLDQSDHKCWKPRAIFPRTVM